MFFYTIKLFFILGAIFIASFNNANANFFEIKYYLQCKSNDFNLTFEFNKLFKTVKFVQFNSKMKVRYWADDSINTSFPFPYSLSNIIPNAKESEEVNANFNRLNGTINLFGTVAPKPSKIKECKKNNNGPWCDSPLVTESFSAYCTKVEKKF